MKKVIAIIQARLGSSRLPHKTMKKIGSETLLKIIIDRVSQSKLIEDIIVATSTDCEDDELYGYVQDTLKCKVERGSLINLLERFYTVAMRHPSEYIVRITADDPFKDAEIIDECVKTITESEDVDYCSNTIRPTFPEGLDIEVFKSSALKKAYENAVLASEKEHVTPYIWKHPEIFNLRNIEYSEDLSQWRWTVDKPEDLGFADTLYGLVGYDYKVSYRKLIEVCKLRPDILLINANTVRNEGYLKSLEVENVK